MCIRDRPVITALLPARENNESIWNLNLPSYENGFLCCYVHINSWKRFRQELIVDFCSVLKTFQQKTERAVDLRFPFRLSYNSYWYILNRPPRSPLLPCRRQQPVHINRLELFAGHGLLKRRQLQDSTEQSGHGPVAVSYTHLGWSYRYGWLRALSHIQISPQEPVCPQTAW